MKNRRLWIVLWTVLMMTLCGCSLAKEDAGEENAGGKNVGEDPLIGVFVTTESLDTFDMDAYLEDNVADLIEGKEVSPDDYAKYSEKIYATIDKKGSIEPSDWEIYFEGIDGINFFDAEFQNEGSEPFRMLSCEGVCDITTGYHSTDDGEKVELTGTIYVLPKADVTDTVYYVNPVYQTEGGEIYVTSGGMGNSIGGLGDGVMMTVTLDGEVTQTENGVAETNAASVKVNFVVSYAPTKIRLHQLDENNQVVKTEEYEQGKLPEQLKAEDETAYIIVETELDNPHKEGDCIREIYERDDVGSTYFETMCVTEKGYIEKQSTEIVWGE